MPTIAFLVTNLSLVALPTLLPLLCCCCCSGGCCCCCCTVISSIVVCTTPIRVAKPSSTLTLALPSNPLPVNVVGDSGTMRLIGKTTCRISWGCMCTVSLGVCVCVIGKTCSPQSLSLSTLFRLFIICLLFFFFLPASLPLIRSGTTTSGSGSEEELQNVSCPSSDQISLHYARSWWHSLAIVESLICGERQKSNGRRPRPRQKTKDEDEEEKKK
ncbi:hypothetical protein F4778DRAFT_612658 [Xylariomycetidae sp. FL2044]|nr:hypothetical protein F4778DRAFT_612658 [Xylariomycetidae sp. FL2044]